MLLVHWGLLAKVAVRYCRTAVIVMFVGPPPGQMPVMAVNPGLVQFKVLPPAEPETANVPVQTVAPFSMAFHVNVPEKLVVVVAPETVPLKKRTRRS